MNAIIRHLQRRLPSRRKMSKPTLGLLTPHIRCCLTPSYLIPAPLLMFSNTLHRCQQADFSSAALLPEWETKPKKTNRSRDPITVTPAAASRIHNLILNHNQARNNDIAIGIRLGTKKRGCNGLSYTLDYAYENHTQKHKRDEAMEISFEDSNTPGNGLKLFIEPMALMNVIGTKMDFVDDEMSSEFTFTNPNSKGECGCGESFNV